MAKAKIWSSGAGIFSLLFFLVAIAGAVLEFIDYYLPTFQNDYLNATTPEIIALIAFIVIIAAAFFALLAIVISIFGIPKILWILFAFASLVCIAVFPIISLIQGNGFPFIETTYFDSNIMDFLGFWLGVGGSFLAMVIGFFVPKRL